MSVRCTPESGTGNTQRRTMSIARCDGSRLSLRGAAAVSPRAPARGGQRVRVLGERAGQRQSVGWGKRAENGAGQLFIARVANGRERRVAPAAAGLWMA